MLSQQFMISITTEYSMNLPFWLLCMCTCVAALLVTQTQSRSIDRKEQSLEDRNSIVHR